MSNYRTHTKFNLLFALPLLIASCLTLLHLNWKLTAIIAGCFTYGTLFMNPDMDLAHQIKLFSLRGILSLPFRTYSMVFRHRGLSHSLLLGTLTRLFWLALYALAILILVYNVDPASKSFYGYLLTQRFLLLAAFGGFFIADACHLFLDRLHSS